MTAAEVLVEVARRGYSATLSPSGQKVVLTPGGDLPADLVALIRAAKQDIIACLLAERERHKALIDDVKQRRPPDVADDRWQAALDGLSAFLAAGHGAKAESLGWPKDELYRVPPLWSRIDLTGAALSIGDREVIEVSAEAIRVKAASGSILSIYRKPQPDYAAVYQLRRKELAHLGGDEPHLRALDHAIFLCRAQSNCSLEEAKAAVRGAIEGKKP
jgi:hypothetical protein